MPNGQVLKPARTLGADVVVMGRLASDDAAQGHEAVEAAPAPILLESPDRDADGGRNLEGAGDGETLEGRTGLLQRLNGAAHHLVRELRIETCFDDHDVGGLGHYARS